MALRVRYMSQAPMQVGEHRGPQVGTLEPRRSLDALEKGEPLRRPAPLGQRHRAVERVERGGGMPLQERVALDDSIPSSRSERRREAVLGCDSGLRVEPGEGPPCADLASRDKPSWISRSSCGGMLGRARRRPSAPRRRRPAGDFNVSVRAPGARHAAARAGAHPRSDHGARARRMAGAQRARKGTDPGATEGAVAELAYGAQQ